MKNLNTPAAIYLAKPEFIPELCEELGEFTYVIENLVFSSVVNTEVCFFQDIWLEPKVVSFSSISEAAHILRQAGKFWYLNPVSHIRRARLIESQLRRCPPLLQPFPPVAEIPSIGCFSLLDQNTMVFSAKRVKPWPLGECFFIEDKINPPNRAYLKLWEALMLLGCYPKPGETALDLGASPGGWTYVMQSLGAKVTSVDKAILDERIARLPGVQFLQQSAFSIDPNTLTEPYDWVLSDVACYPERAYTLIKKWIDSGKAKHMIFTIKLQGKTDLSVLQAFKEIPSSRIINMYYNKHEATFFLG